MRTLILLACTTMLAACGGAGPQSAGGVAPPTGSVPVGGGGSDEETHSFVNPTRPATYTSIGATHSYSYTVDDAGNAGAGQAGQLYQGNASTARDSDLSIAFSPRDAIFDISFGDNLAGTSVDVRFQDPIHRTDFGGLVEPQIGTLDLEAANGVQGINYLEAGSRNNVVFSIPGQFVFDLIDPSQGGSYDATTFFQQTPGTETQFVTFAGFLRNQATVTNIEVENADGSTTEFLRQQNSFERGVLAYGELTRIDDVPTTGTGSFEGTTVASLVFNDQPDAVGNFDTYFQTLVGRATTTVDFGANTFALDLDGIVGAPLLDGTSGLHSLRENALFTANGGGNIDLVGAGGFLGQFDRAFFVNPDGSRLDLVIAGSSIDGAFFGPNGEEVGGGYRIVGGTPDQRIDILGTFVGAQD